MSIEIIILIVVIVGFILTWVFCSKMPEPAITKDDMKFFNGDAWELSQLRQDNRALLRENARLRDNQCSHYTHIQRCTTKPTMEEIEKSLGIKRPEEPKEFKVEGVLKVKA